MDKLIRGSLDLIDQVVLLVSRLRLQAKMPVVVGVACSLPLQPGAVLAVNIAAARPTDDLINPRLD